jgi:hypothetical protein
MDQQPYKEVYFHEYCEKCEHWDKDEDEEPCATCLSDAINLNSHKPTMWEEKQTK